MSGTIAVVALDAADYQLAQDWECENILLESHGPLETFTHSLDHPFTPEVWTSIATGKHPDEHGVENDAADWDSALLRLASKVTQYLPYRWRHYLGKPFRDRGHEQVIHQTGSDHIFDSGAAFGWPGVTEAEHLSEAWGWASEVTEGTLAEHELETKVMGNTGQELGWLIGMDNVGLPIAGVHSHALDITGHTFATRETMLREYYERIDELLGFIREKVSELVILSDHGMQVEWLDDDDPGAHSMRAMVSTTKGITGRLPESVFDVRGWLERNIETSPGRESKQATMDTAEGRLRELGYID